MHTFPCRVCSVNNKWSSAECLKLGKRESGLTNMIISVCLRNFPTPSASYHDYPCLNRRNYIRCILRDTDFHLFPILHEVFLVNFIIFQDYVFSMFSLIFKVTEFIVEYEFFGNLWLFLFYLVLGLRVCNSKIIMIYAFLLNFLLLKECVVIFQDFLFSYFPWFLRFSL